MIDRAKLQELLAEMRCISDDLFKEQTKLRVISNSMWEAHAHLIDGPSGIRMKYQKQIDELRAFAVDLEYDIGVTIAKRVGINHVLDPLGRLLGASATD